MTNSLKIAVDDVVVVERTKLNPKLPNKTRRKLAEANDYINTIKLASKGYRGRIGEESQLNAEDRKIIELMTEKKEKKKGWALLCC